MAQIAPNWGFEPTFSLRDGTFCARGWHGAPHRRRAAPLENVGPPWGLEEVKTPRRTGPKTKVLHGKNQSCRVHRKSKKFTSASACLTKSIPHRRHYFSTFGSLTSYRSAVDTRPSVPCFSATLNAVLLPSSATPTSFPDSHVTIHVTDSAADIALADAAAVFASSANHSTATVAANCPPP